MFKVIGFQRKNLKFKDGSEVSGVTLYVTEVRNGVNGFACDSLFVSDIKLGDYTPNVGDTIEIRWNRWGKVEGVYLAKK